MCGTEGVLQYSPNCYIMGLFSHFGHIGDNSPLMEALLPPSYFSAWQAYSGVGEGGLRSWNGKNLGERSGYDWL